MSRLGDRARRTPLLQGLPPEVAVIAAIAFCVALGFGIVAPAIPIYAQSFGVTAFLAGAVVSVFALMRLISSPGAGALVDRVGERNVLTTGLIIVAVSSVLAGLAQDYVQLLVLRGVGGIGSSMFTVSAMALLLKVVTAQQRGRAAGAFQAGFLLGGVAGPAVGGAVVALSIRAPFFFYAGTLALAALVSWRFLPAEPPGQPVPHHATPAAAATDDGDDETTPTEPQHHSDTTAGAPDNDAHDSDPDKAPTLPQALRSPAYQAALAANLTNGFVTFGLRSSLVPLFVIEGLNADATLVGHRIPGRRSDPGGPAAAGRSAGGPTGTSSGVCCGDAVLTLVGMAGSGCGRGDLDVPGRHGRRGTGRRIHGIGARRRRRGRGRPRGQGDRHRGLSDDCRPRGDPRVRCWPGCWRIRSGMGRRSPWVLPSRHWRC
ncbi:MAG: MFS transporter [Candidatus Nanopelagicales bacterium]